MTEEAKPAEKVEEPVQFDILLAQMDIRGIDGIDTQLGAKLNKVGINTIEELAYSDPKIISDETKIPYNKVIEHKKKAQLLVELEFDPDLINVLGEKKYTLEQAIEEETDYIVELSNLSVNRVTEFQEKVKQVTIYLDVKTCRETLITALPKMKQAIREPKGWERYIYWIEIIIAVGFVASLVMTLSLAVILL